jgi:sugar-specific transcriptional regulator TrmB
MVSANNFTKVYAEALVLGTPKDELVNPEVPKKKQGMTREQIAKMELEMETIERDLKAVEKSYGENMLSLTVIRGYIKRLLENAKVVKFLTGNHREILSEFESTAASETV